MLAQWMFSDALKLPAVMNSQKAKEMQKNPVSSTSRARHWLTLTAVLVLSGCGFGTKQVEVVSAPLERVPLVLPKVDKLQTDPIEWYVITPENQSEVFDLLEKKNYDVVLFGITDEGYENLSVNMAKILRLVEQQRLIINAYEEYYQQQERAIDEHQSLVRELENSVTKQ